MLLSSNVIHICVIVVMLVRMIHTRFFAAARVKSCPGMHSSCVIASLYGYACTVGHPRISGVAKELVKARIQLHLTPMIGRLLVSHMLHICMHLELYPLQVSRDGL